jgi:hypothetical protein
MKDSIVSCCHGLGFTCPRCWPPREFVFNLTFPNRGTESFTIKARSEADAKAQISRIYPEAEVNWIL